MKLLHVHILSTKQITTVLRKGSHDCVTDASFGISKLLAECLKCFLLLLLFCWIWFLLDRQREKKPSHHHNLHLCFELRITKVGAYRALAFAASLIRHAVI